MPDSCSSILIVWAKYLSASERYHLVLLENTIDYLVLSSHQPLEMQEFGIFCWLSSFSDISILNISQMVTPKPINHTILWKSLTRSFRCSKYFAQTVTNFLLSSAENTKKNESFVTLGVQSTLWVLTVGIFHFLILISVKFNSLGSLLSIMFWSVKCTFTCQRWHFQDY